MSGLNSLLERSVFQTAVEITEVFTNLTATFIAHMREGIDQLHHFCFFC